MDSEDLDPDSSEMRLPAPTIGEVGRAVNNLQRNVNQLRFELAQTYVRQDVWQTAENGAGIRVGEVVRDINEMKVLLEKENIERKTDVEKESIERKKDLEKIVSSRDADRRLIFTALIAPIITGVLVAIIVLGLKP